MASNGNNGITVNIHVGEIEKYTEESIKTALTAVGLQIENYAKANCAVDTGLLRNSIAHALSGEVPSIGDVYGKTEKHHRQYKANRAKSGDEDEQEEIKKGSYSQRTPKATNAARMKVYVGTNVEYAPYVEMGHRQQVGRYVPALGKRLVAPEVKSQPYLRPAFLEHMDEYKDVIEAYLREEFENIDND